jgi:hypothetical protein
MPRFCMRMLYGASGKALHPRRSNTLRTKLVIGDRRAACSGSDEALNRRERVRREVESKPSTNSTSPRSARRRQPPRCGNCGYSTGANARERPLLTSPFDPDCHYETICESCTCFVTIIESRPPSKPTRPCRQQSQTADRRSTTGYSNDSTKPGLDTDHPQEPTRSSRSYSTQLPVVPLQMHQPAPIIAGQARLGAGIELGPHHPAGQRVPLNAQLLPTRLQAPVTESCNC